MERKHRVLIIDDDERHLIATKEILEGEGYEVIIHQGAFGSTAIIGNIRPDLVLLDVNMPGLSGEKLATLLKSNDKTRSIPVVFYSSNDEDSLRKAVAEYKVKGYICKGNLCELRTKVAYYLMSGAGQKQCSISKQEN
ncbi:MAG: response regulator [Thermodesulfovibrionales bacterium]|nr:response regulator [Thermodesulfovibrionales bacterium]